MAIIDEKWEGIEEVNKTKLVMGVLYLIGYLFSLGSLTEEKLPL